MNEDAKKKDVSENNGNPPEFQLLHNLINCRQKKVFLFQSLASTPIVLKNIKLITATKMNNRVQYNVENLGSLCTQHGLILEIIIAKLKYANRKPLRSPLFHTGM